MDTSEYPYPAPDVEEPHRWQEDASCRGMDPDVFMPHRGESTALAKSVCQGCVVIEPCKEYALAQSNIPGVYGGTSERQRRTIRTARRHGA